MFLKTLHLGKADLEKGVFRGYGTSGVIDGDAALRSLVLKGTA